MRPRQLFLAFLAAAVLGAQAPAGLPETAQPFTLPVAAKAFLVEPYLQLGAVPSTDSLSLLWHSPDQEGEWSVELRVGDRPVVTILPAWFRVAVPSVEPHRVYGATLRPLVPGGSFSYQVLLDGRPVFASTGRALKAPGQAQRVVLAADLAMDPEPARAMARQWSLQGPDLVLLPGDLVYQDGRISEYRRSFFPVYNGGAAAGAPLMRGTAFVGVLGNHDVGERGPRHPHAVDPDSMAYYLYWDQPLNGPPLDPEGPHAPLLAPGPDWSWAAFLAGAGKRFPTMGSFSFDSGDVHWTVLDSNPYVRWEAPELREWLARDLEAARGALWRIVLFHHPAFNLGEGNVYQDQWMARLWPVFERGRVDLVFTGHIHTYVRTQPIRFTPAAPGQAAGGAPAAGKVAGGQAGEVPGRLAWDTRFDGRSRTVADGVIHIVTGGGGAPLHLKGRSAQLRPKPYVVRVISEEYSFSVMDVAGRTLTFRQLGLNGAVLDRFTLTKPPGPIR
jgi:hypothetical protein